MQKLRIINQSNLPISTWSDFSIPNPSEFDSGVALVEIGGKKRKFLGLKGSDGFFSAKLDLLPSEDFFVEVIPASYPYTFKLSNWVVDNLEDLIPSVEISFNGAVTSLSPTKSKILISNEALKLYELEGYNLGWKITVWYFLYSDQDTVDVQFCITWSDRANPSWFKELDKIVITTKEELFLDFAPKLGVTLGSSPDDFGNYRTTLLNNYLNLGDGQRLDFYGALFCRPKWMSVKAERERLTQAQIDEFLATNRSRFVNFDSRKQFPVSVMATNWNGNLGPAKVYFSTYGREQGDMTTRVINHLNQMNSPGSYFDPRYFSNSPNTGATGDQVVFGAGKDSPAVVTADGRFIHILRYHHTYPFRPFHWHETNGDPLKAADHPNCTTWSMLPDHRLGSDMLGKPHTWVPGNWTGGYAGADEEHRQQLYETFAMTMAREPMLRASTKAALQTDVLAKPGRMGAARSIGRQIDTWLEIAHVMPELKSFTDLAIRDKLNATKNQWTGRYVTGPIKPVTVVGPDGRGLINYEYWVPWEGSLFSIGVFKYLKTVTDESIRQLLLDVTRSIVEFGFIWHPVQNRYLTMTCIRWLANGERPIITDIDTQIGTGNDKEFRTDSNLTVWTLPALQVYLNLTDDTAADVNDPLRDKAKSVLNFVFPNGPESARNAEWLALRKW